MCTIFVLRYKGIHAGTRGRENFDRHEAVGGGPLGWPRDVCGMGMDWEGVGLTCAPATGIAAELCDLHSFLLAPCSQAERDMEFRPLLQTLDERRLPPEMAKTSSRAEERARRWSQTDGGKEEGAPFAPRAGGLILSSAEAARRAKLGGRSRWQGGVSRDEVGWGQRAVLQAVRLRGVKTLSIGQPHPNPLAMLPSPPPWLQFRRVGLLLRTRGGELGKGISSISSWGSPWRLGCCKDLPVCDRSRGCASTANRGCCSNRQEIKWQATLQHQWGASGKPPSVCWITFWQGYLGE